MAFDALPASPPPFPGVPLDVRVELGLSGTWTDITSKYVYQRDVVTIGRGHPDESTTTAASTLTLTLKNTDGRFSSLNPASPYYGSLGRNTPIRVSFPEGASYLRLETDQQSYASGAPAINPAGDIDIQLDVTLDNWNAGTILAGKWAETGNQRSWLLLLNDIGSLTFVTSTSGTAASGSAFSTVALPLPPLLRQCLRVTYASATGQVTFYTAPRGTLGSPSWTQVDQLTIASGALFASTTTPVQVGWCSGATAQTSSTPGIYGKVHAFVIKNSIGGSTVTSPDFTQQTAGASSFTDGQSITWTLAGTSEISDRKYRFHGEVAAWPQAWNNAGTDVSIQISASGLLRRLGRNAQPLNSALYRAGVRLTGSLAPVAYWPGEDSPGSTQIASATGGQAMSISGPATLASFSGFACSGPLPVLNGATFSGIVPAYTPAGSDNVLRFLMAVPSGGDVNGGIVARMATTGQIRYVTLTYGSGSGGTLTYAGFDHTGAAFFNSGPGAFNVNGALVLVSIALQQSGANVNWQVQTVVPGSSSAGTLSGTVSTATTGNMTGVLVNPKGTLTGTAVGQWMMQSVLDPAFDNDIAGPLIAWSGETAGTRFARLCSEEGVAFRGRGRAADSVPMGSQGLQTLTSLLQECADADRGQWTEPRQVLGWGYRTRTTLGNQTATVSLAYTAATISGLTPTEDDQTTQNDITVSNTDGSSSRQVLTSGALSVNSPPAGIGRYSAAAQVNLASDSQLDSEAGWLLHLGTVNESRYPGVAVNMARSQLASVYYDLQDMDAGDRLVITSPPAWLPPGQVDQLVQGITETGTYRTFTETFACVPSSPWNVAYSDDLVYGRADTDGSALAIPATSGATTLQVVNSVTPWTSAGGDLPFDINAAGEKVTVTAVSNAGRVMTRTGVYMDQTNFQQADYNGGASLWHSFSGQTLPATRYYANTNYTLTTNLSQMITAGVRIAISFNPGYAPVSSADRASIVSLLSSMKTAGADAVCTIWHEPHTGGLSASQYTAAVQYYAPAMRAFFPFFTVLAGLDNIESNGYYPGDAYTDGVACDVYLTSGFDFSNNNLINAQAMADNHGKPLAIWEFNTTRGPNFLTGDNHSFAATVGNWVTGHNAPSVVHSTVTNPFGVQTGALLMTATVAGTTSSVQSAAGASFATQMQACSSGDEITVGAWCQAVTTGRACTAGASFYTSGGTFISTVLSADASATATDGTGGWTAVTGKLTAPATAAWYAEVVSVALPALGEGHRIGMVYCADSTTTGHTQGGSTTWWQWLQGIMTARIAAGKPNSDVLLFNAGVPGTSIVDAIQYSSDYRVGLWQAIVTALDSTSPAQALTVTRSVNGVVKAQSAGTDVRLFVPPIVSL